MSNWQTIFWAGLAVIVVASFGLLVWEGWRGRDDD